MKWLLMATALVVTPAMAQVKIENAWARATPPGASLGVGYMTIRNGFGAFDRLIAVSSPAAGKVEMHVTVQDGEVSRMREVKGYEVPARGTFELAPGGAHLMFVDIKAPFKEGGKVPLVMRFEKAGEVKTELAVRPLGASGPERGREHMHQH